MASLEHLDILLGDSLERLVEASDEVRNIQVFDDVNKKRLLRRMGRLVSEIWSFRDEIYGIEPSLKRDFILEHEQDRERYESLNKLHLEAFEMEKIDNIDLARELYQQLYSVSRFGYFRLLAESGLYRVSHRNDQRQGTVG